MLTWTVEQVLKQPLPRYVYVISLRGEGLGFTLGALVLGNALRNHGTKHNLVLLHTSDIPSHLLDLL